MVHGLHSEIAADRDLVHLLATAGEHDLAALHDQIGGGEVAGEVEILLDQEDLPSCRARQ